jgi:hypothetical protein
VEKVKASIAGIYDRGSLDKERVHFRADVDLDLSFFILLDSQFVPLLMSQVSAGNHSAFWFGPQQIPRGHHVVVYTRAGVPNVETREDGSVYHFFFRSQSNPLYALPQACAVVLEVQTWASTGMSPATALPPLPSPELTSLGLAGSPSLTVGEALKSGALGGLMLGNLFDYKEKP